MTHDELERQEETNRDLIEAMGKLSRDAQVSPGFVPRILAQADQRRTPHRGLLDWALAPVWASTARVRVAVAVLLLFAVIGAVPQYLTWINAYIMGIPSDTVHQARMQERLWEKNFICATQLDRSSSNYAAITGEHVVVVAWACPSGDVLVTVESTTDDVLRRSVWIPLDSQRHTAGLLQRLVQTAFAADHFRQAKKRPTPMVTVLCQKWLPNRLIIRRVQLANGRCFDEVINPRTGKVKRHRKAPCDRKC